MASEAGAVAEELAGVRANEAFPAGSLSAVDACGDEFGLVAKVTPDQDGRLGSEARPALGADYFWGGIDAVVAFGASVAAHAPGRERGGAQHVVDVLLGDAKKVCDSLLGQVGVGLSHGADCEGSGREL